MNFKKSNAPLSTITRDLFDLDIETGNIYESIATISKRANQISAEIKSELSTKLEEFASFTDNLEEIFENRTPKKKAITCSRIRPSTREAAVAPDTIPADPNSVFFLTLLIDKISLPLIFTG